MDGNPARQAIQTTYALSDSLHDFTARVPATPGPTDKRFYRDVDTVVCAFPAVPAGSRLQTYKYVDVIGYQALLQRITQTGPAPAWSSADWDAFGQYLNVYREEDESQEGASVSPDRRRSMPTAGDSSKRTVPCRRWCPRRCTRTARSMRARTSKLS